MPGVLRAFPGTSGKIPDKTKGSPFTESPFPCLGLSWMERKSLVDIFTSENSFFSLVLKDFPVETFTVFRGENYGGRNRFALVFKGQPWGIFVSHATKKPGKGRGRGFLLRPSKVNDKRERGRDILKIGCSLCKRKGAGE